MFLLGFVCLLYLTVLWFLGPGPIGTRPLLFLGLLLVMVGAQLISTGPPRRDDQQHPRGGAEGI